MTIYRDNDLRNEDGKQAFLIKSVEAIETIGPDSDWIVYLKDESSYILRCSLAISFNADKVIFS